MAFKAMIRAMRPHHWLKNGLVFIPILLNHDVFDLESLGQGLVAFISFSLMASSIYLLNDIVDVEADRRHPTKCKRPLAAGEITARQAYMAVPALLAAAFALSLLLPQPRLFVLALTAYLGLALAYLFVLKRKLLVDVLGLAALHTLRILAGNAAAAIPLSSWLLAFSMFLFLSLALVKRYAELRITQDQSGLKKAGRGYHAEDIEALSQLGMASGCTCALILALYVDSAAVKQLYRHPELIWLICPIVLYQMSRVWFLARRGLMPDDPLVFMISDWRSQVTGSLVLLIMVAATILP
ncbi:UbiA family prenyltransferase [Bosea psychrotolerans]|uniref:4-hydroxybenzoate polyprenyltransferase n=1 Tax=Bosea psychrotolerans TaxID=1871628 RepID=A0A2S4LS03_9HYPH|nr:UbiA family prenyltransferase [Bosea psychrotolerans]POR45231.1 4-hydroxybenzoate polyprenyltransferase [Bosea psychrotolerans]